jgi:hypothetical protein
MERINKPIIQRAGNDAIYGNGSDGDATVNDEVTITDDMYYNNLTITGTGFLKTNGYRVFVKNTLTINSGGQIGVGPTSGNDPTDVQTRTIGGHTTGAISYRIGGQGGGGTNPDIPTLPSFLLKDINVLSSGLAFHPVFGIVALQGGSAGTTGSAGATTPALTNPDSWTGKAGAAGSPGGTSNYGNANPNANTVGVPGGRGSDASPGNVTNATPGPGGAGGAGGSGGPVVCVVAKTILGSGSIVALGKKGAAGSVGSSGNPGSQGANGAPAPNSSHHVPNPHHHVAPTTGRFHSHTYSNSRHSDCFAHWVKAANHHAPAQHTAASGKTPAHHAPAVHHENPHHHHTGGFHNPTNDGTFGRQAHWHNDSWHRRYQISHANGISFNFRDLVGHHTGTNNDHNAAIGNGTHNLVYYHQHAGGSNNTAHYGAGVTHTPFHFGSVHTPAHSVNPNWHFFSHTNPDLPQSPAAVDQVVPGGAGGVNNGTTTGRGAPAVTGETGKQGGYGGGGAVLVITDSVSDDIIYNTSARTGADADNFSAEDGSVYILINQ